MNTTGERLRTERERLGLNQETFGELGGVKKRTQINYESNERAADTDYLGRLASNGVDVLYVVTGTRQPDAPAPLPAPLRTYDEPAPYRAEVLRPGDPDYEDADPEQYVVLKRYDLRAHAGPGAAEDEYPELIEQMKVLRDLLVQNGIVKPDVIELRTVWGDSMAKSCPNGSVALLDHTVRRFEDDGIYVMRWNDGVIIKRLSKEIDGTIAVSSDNDDKTVYPTRYLTAQQFAGVQILARFRVVLSVKRV